MRAQVSDALLPRAAGVARPHRKGRTGVL